jgi:hypothetical protein
LLRHIPAGFRRRYPPRSSMEHATEPCNYVVSRLAVLLQRIFVDERLEESNAEASGIASINLLIKRGWQHKLADAVKCLNGRLERVSGRPRFSEF